MGRSNKNARQEQPHDKEREAKWLKALSRDLNSPHKSKPDYKPISQSSYELVYTTETRR